ncbi:hypothetical protein FJZ27_01120 [Candidatus Peribacteria bacterium]|nr:hypothetical protein [Candidatus Peribacteria bacterium]
MHIAPESPQHTERVLALQMIFLGLSVLLGLVVLIQFGSPSHRMNADGVYSTAPSYGVPRYPRPIEEYIEEDDNDHEGGSASSVRSSASSASARSTEYNRKTRRARGGLRARVSGGDEDRAFAPGWFRR